MVYAKTKLRELICLCDEINKNLELSSVDDLQGINNDKYFQGCQSNKNDIELNRYRICRKGWFAYNKATSRNGEKISIAYRYGQDCLVSPSYICFKIKDENILCHDYLMMFFKRADFDKYVRFNSWGSATEFFTFEDMCDVEIPLPTIEKQREIISRLSFIDDRRNKISALIDDLDSFAEKYFCDALNNDSFIDGVFSSFIADTVSGDWGEEHKAGNHTEAIKCIRGADLDDACLCNIEPAPVRYILPKNVETKKLSAGNIVVEMSGGSPIQATGRVTIISEELLNSGKLPIVCCNFCRAIIPQPDSEYYVFQYWKHLYNLGVMFQYENSSTGLKNFMFDEFVSQEIIKIPDDKSLKIINQHLKTIYKYKSFLGLELVQLDRLYRTTIDYVFEKEVL